MFSSIEAVPLPDDAMVGRYAGTDCGYTDCYSVELKGLTRLAEYIEAFYTSPVFKLERFVLSVLFAKPSTDAQARELATGDRDAFSAWRVEDRDSKQILLSDFRGRTRSWLMVEPMLDAQSTRLYFGSAVISPRNPSGPVMGPSLLFRMLLGFHRLYSKILLSLARRALVSRSCRGDW